jgi:UDP-N-acetylglucosamine 2-epimerase (non-hydrolysing)/GDP/UDP-N,N'-diacetylbacillosamine 2-epimerase (hydrolysing)
MRKIGIVSVSRSDYSFYKPIMQLIENDSSLEMIIYASGMHLSPEFGMTVREIEDDGFQVDEKIVMNLSSDSEEAISKSIGLGVIGFSQVFNKNRPDILLLLGDRYEMFAAAVSTIPFQIPLAHIHGGEITTGAFDNTFRHAITKMSHLHFAATKEYADRIVQMGEEPWRVYLSGSPSLDNIEKRKTHSKKYLENKYHISLNPYYFLVTFHPTTLESTKTDFYILQLLEALKQISTPIIFTLSNSDTTGRLINSRIREFCIKKDNAYLVESFGTEDYFSAMANAKLMIGNSSSGIIEAPSFKLPVVNIGNRQEGRHKALNVIDVGNTEYEILAGIEEGLSKEFNQKIKNISNPYHPLPSASGLIIETIKEIKLDMKLLVKKFFDICI